MLPRITLEPQKQATASIIWLHGLGASGHDFEPIVPSLGLSEHTRFIFPHAPMRPITVYDGYKMRAWYDIYNHNIIEKEDKVGFETSMQQIGELIEHEIEQGIPSERIILVGFSQGGATTLQVGLRCPKKLAGMLVLSAYLPFAETFENEISDVNRSTPIMMAHGLMDNIVPIQLAKKSKDILTKAGYSVSWHEYPMLHSLCPKEIGDIKAWLMERIGDFGQRIS